jgi:hypothetical protein
MRSLAADGRTMLTVTHEMGSHGMQPAVSRLWMRPHCEAGEGWWARQDSNCNQAVMSGQDKERDR